METALDAVFGRWSEYRESIPKDALSLYYQMASSSGKYPPSPPLQPTWDALRKSLEEKISVNCSFGEAQASDIEEMLKRRFRRSDQNRRSPVPALHRLSWLRLGVAKPIHCHKCRRRQSSKSFSVENDELYEIYMDESRRLKNVSEAIERLNKVYKALEGPCLDEAGEIVSAASTSVGNGRRIPCARARLRRTSVWGGWSNRRSNTVPISECARG